MRGDSAQLATAVGLRDNIFAVPVSDTRPYVQELQLQIQRAMSGERRLLIAFEMSMFARELAKEGFRQEHPEWTDQRVTRERLRLALLPASLPARLQ